MTHNESRQPHGTESNTRLASSTETAHAMNEGSAQRPTISVLIPTYNRAEFVAAALASVYAQLSLADEVVVVDDGSSDSTPQAVEPFLTRGVRYIRKEHSGAPATRNRAVEEATGDYVLWLDSDDVLIDTTIQHYRAALDEDPSIDVLYGTLVIVDNNLNITGKKLEHPDWRARNRELVSTLLMMNVLPNPGTLVRKNLYERFGGYALDFPRAHDYEFWTRIAPHATFQRLHAPVVLWRWHDANMSAPSVDFNTSYDARIVQKLLDTWGLEELFFDLPWDEPSRARSEAIASLRITQRFLHLNMSELALPYLQRSHALMPTEDTALLLEELGASTPIGSPSPSADPPLKVLMAVHRFPPDPPGGVEMYTEQLARELQAQGHEVHILAARYNGEAPAGQVTQEDVNGLTVWRITTRTDTIIHEFRQEDVGKGVASFLATLRPDVVHVQHLIGLTLPTLEAIRRAGYPTVLTLHDGWFACHQFHFLEDGVRPCSGPETIDKCVNCFVHRTPGAESGDHLPELFYYFALRRQQMQRAYQGFDRVLVPTRFLLDKLIQAGFNHPATELHPLGLPETQRLPHLAGNGRLRFVLPGNVFPTKGQDIALRAFAQLPADRCELHIHGSEVNDEYLKQLRRLIPEGHHVTFHGRYTAEELPGMYANADVCIVPSRSENYPLVTRESLQAGVPVIAARVGGMEEIVEDGINGLLVKPVDPRDLARAMQRVLEEPDLLAHLRANTGKVLSMRDDARSLVKIYRSLVPIAEGAAS